MKVKLEQNRSQGREIGCKWLPKCRRVMETVGSGSHLAFSESKMSSIRKRKEITLSF